MIRHSLSTTAQLAPDTIAKPFHEPFYSIYLLPRRPGSFTNQRHSS